LYPYQERINTKSRLACGTDQAGSTASWRAEEVISVVILVNIAGEGWAEFALLDIGAFVAWI
jgi:hypothetical protein